MTARTCVECGIPTVEQREWRRNPKIRPGRRKFGGYGRCQACYVRGRRHGTLVTVTTVCLVRCDQCGTVGEAKTRRQAAQLRDEHMAGHGITSVQPQLSDAEVARLRRLVGAA